MIWSKHNISFPSTRIDTLTIGAAGGVGICGRALITHPLVPRIRILARSVAYLTRALSHRSILESWGFLSRQRTNLPPLT